MHHNKRKTNYHIHLIFSERKLLDAINQEFDEAYQNGNWKYHDCNYRIIHRLCVNPIYQKQGIATETRKYIEDELRKSNIKAIRLDVFSQNPVALALYSRQGYENVGIADWRKGRFFLMEKHL